MNKDWMKYEGSCILFCGIAKHNNSYVQNETDIQWILESEEETNARLTRALEIMGIIAEEITIKWVDIYTGQRCCKCICLYDKWVQTHSFDADYFLEGEVQYSDLGGAVEFTFDKML
jgi:hypothetical protein